jgi:hypothetical protein
MQAASISSTAHARPRTTRICRRGKTPSLIFMKTPEPDFHKDILNQHGRDEHRFLKLPQAHRRGRQARHSIDIPSSR